MPIRDEMVFDKRIVERNIRVGLTDHKSYQTHLKKLKDLAQDVAEIESEVPRIRHRIPDVPENDEDEL